MDLQRAKRLVAQYTAARDPAVVEQVAQRMVDTGECVWHAFAQVTGKACWCAACAGGMGLERRRAI